MSKKATNSFLIFRLDGDLFALSVNKVLEIIEVGEEHTITRVPKSPPTVAGVVNFRGNVIPIINTRIKFGIQPYASDEKFVLMVLNLKINEREHCVGAMADKVVDVIEIKEEEIKPVPEINQDYNFEFIEGIIRRDNNFIMLLDLEAAIKKEEISSLKTETTIVTDEAEVNDSL